MWENRGKWCIENARKLDDVCVCGGVSICCGVCWHTRSVRVFVTVCVFSCNCICLFLCLCVLCLSVSFGMRHNFGSHFLQIWTVVFPHKIPWDFHSHTLIWFSTSACYCGGQFLWWKDHLFNTRLLWWARACVRACMRTCVRACVRACGRSCMCVCVRAYVCVCVCGGWVIAAAQEWCVQNVREVRECERRC